MHEVNAPHGLLIETAHPTLRIDGERVRSVLTRLLTDRGVGVAYLGIVLADHDTVRALNAAYLDHATDTDVLSFNLSEEAAALIDGEVYVDLDTALERHAEFGAAFEDEALRYVIHGVLHLLGYDDETVEQKSEMHRLEDAYLAGRRL
jgi:probable rRNA maturation factor